MALLRFEDPFSSVLALQQELERMLRSSPFEPAPSSSIRG
jgi:hypothetical protein